jgi:hypothetical protein
MQRMAQTGAERTRAYRERQRNGVTPHSCELCGWRHYPVTGNAVTPNPMVAPSTPPRDGVTPCPLCDGVTPCPLCDGVTPCPLCEAASARVAAMVERLDRFAAYGKRLQAANARMARLLRDHGIDPGE